MLGAMALALLVAWTALLAPSAVAAEPPPTLWNKCLGGSSDISCGIVRGVAADRDPPGHVYALDQGGFRVLEFTSRGEFVKAWGWDVVESGPGDDTVAPEDEFEICVAGVDVCKAGLPGPGTGQFNGTQGIAVDGSGAIYVADRNNFRVQKFSPAGEFLLMFGGEVNKTKTEAAAPAAQRNRCPVDPGDACQAGTGGTDPGQFGGPGPSNGWAVGDFIAIDASDNVYVGDVGRIQRFNTDGEFAIAIPTGERTVRSLAADSAGNLLAAYTEFGVASSAPNVDKLSSLGFPLCQAEVTTPTAVASDVTDASGRFFAFDASENEIMSFDSLCASEGSDFAVDGVSASTGLDAGSACLSEDALTSFGPNLYVTNPSSSSPLARGYGQPPNPTICLPPPNDPIVVDQYALSVDTDSATVGAEIDPRGWPDARYHVQYATAACVAGGDWTAGCVEERPAPPGSLLAGEGLVTNTTVFLHGLQPDTEYRFRFVVESGFALADTNGPVFGLDPDGEGPGEASLEDGLATRLTTFPPPSGAKLDCANQAFRIDRAAFLPDCRAYEMVSPVEKGGGDISAPADLYAGRDVALDQAAPAVPESGRGLTYSTRQAFDGAPSALGVNQYLARRDAEDGWSSQALFPQRESSTFFGSAALFDLNFEAFSPDLRYGWLLHEAEPPLDACAPPGFPNYYRRDNLTSAYRVLSCEEIVALGPLEMEFQGATDDGADAVFRARSALTADAAAADLEAFKLYRWDEASGAAGLELVSVRPNGTPCPGGPFDAEASAGSVTNIINTGRWQRLAGALSADGKRIYWSCSRRLYLYDESTGLSVAVSEKASTASAHFWAASPDGSRALFTVGDLEGGAATLYRYDAASETVSEIAAQVRGLLGASADTSRAYLVSEADLDGAGPAQAGDPNLYLAEAGEGPAALTFVAALSSDDARATPPGSAMSSPVTAVPVTHSARVTPDGRHAAFMSNSPELAELVADYDNTDAASGEPDTEVYLYQADSGQLHCASCNRGGARPRGRDVAPGTPEFWVSGRIPTWAYSLYPQRPLSDDGGHLFFESFDPLVSRDTNGRQDVYEWHPADSEAECAQAGAELFVQNTSGAGGCISLISSGESAQDSDFADASADGRDVFFKTHESLLPQDPGLRDIYDARSLGGFAPLDPPQPPCEGEACQSPPAPPDPPNPASAALLGNGNHPSARKKRCRRGKRKVVRKGRARCVKKHRKHRKRAKRRKGRARR